MTPSDLKAACDRAGGVYALARMIDKRPMYLYRRLRPDKGKDQPDPISTMDELAILKALKLKSVKQLNRKEPNHDRH